MSFPYTTTSPPPTSGALTVVDKANVSQSYAGGGGGGGGGGPLLNVSTINFNSADINGNIPSQQNMRNAGSGGVVGFNGACLAFDKDPVPNVTVLMGYNASSDAIQITQASGAGYGSAALQVDAILCSTINGAVPGGAGAGPNLQVSTLSVNDTGNITLDWNSGGGTLNFGFEATNTSSFILQQGIGVVGTKVAGPEGCLQALEKDGAANPVFAPLQASGFEVCATAYPGGAFAGLYFSSIGSVLYSAVGQPLTIDAPAGVSVSSLTVSSINGAAPGGGGNPYPLPSTLKKGDAVGLPLNASSLTTLAAFSTISSHFYTVSVDITPRQLTQTFGPIDAYQSQLTTDDGLVNILNNGLWSEVSTLYNSALSITPGLGGSATFKAGGSNMTVDVYNTYNNFLSTNLNAIFAVDHGPGP